MTKMMMSVATLLLAATASAQAQEIVIERPVERGVGIGFGATPGGVAGLSLEANLNRSLLLNLTAGVSTFSPKNDNGDSLSNLGVAAALFYRWKSWDNVALMVGGRLDVNHASGGNVGYTAISLEAPLRAEVYFARSLSVYCEVALVARFVTDGDNAFGPGGKGFYLDLPLGQLLGTFGAAYYFD